MRNTPMSAAAPGLNIFNQNQANANANADAHSRAVALSRARYPREYGIFAAKLAKAVGVEDKNIIIQNAINNIPSITLPNL